MEVGTFPPNPYGLLDMEGNVFEWVEDCWNPTHAGAPADASPRGGDCKRRVAKGGAWYYEAEFARPSARMSFPKGGRPQRHRLPRGAAAGISAAFTLTRLADISSEAPSPIKGEGLGPAAMPRLPSPPRGRGWRDRRSSVAQGEGDLIADLNSRRGCPPRGCRSCRAWVSARARTTSVPRSAPHRRCRHKARRYRSACRHCRAAPRRPCRQGPRSDSG